MEPAVLVLGLLPPQLPHAVTVHALPRPGARWRVTGAHSAERACKGAVCGVNWQAQGASMSWTRLERPCRAAGRRGLGRPATPYRAANASFGCIWHYKRCWHPPQGPTDYPGNSGPGRHGFRGALTNLSELYLESASLSQQAHERATRCFTPRLRRA